MNNTGNLEPKIDTVADLEHKREVGGRMFDVIVLPPEDPSAVKKRDGIGPDYIHPRGGSYGDQGSGRKLPTRGRRGNVDGYLN